MNLRNNRNMKIHTWMKKGMFLLILSGCLILAGCQKETGLQEQHTDVPGSTIIAAADKIEYTKVTGKETVNAEEEDTKPEEDAHRSMLVISVLGKEELAIETERLYADKSRPGYLDNRFTSEEIDAILNTIEGAWSIDEYVGFAPYATVERWMGEGTYEEKRERYRETRERAEKNPPDFFFRVKSDSSAEPAVSSHYIYVYNDNKVYASPMSIVLSKQEEEKPYQGGGRTIQGAGIPMQSYPVIYIEFFAVSESEAGAVSYEPATLVLASDGSFLLLKDGAFYSLKNSIQGQLMSGDFSYLEDTDWERMQESYEREIDLYEWCQLDLNSDGIEDLILQEKSTADEDSNQHRILGIFGCGKDEARCVLWDDVYMGDFSFCGSTGELMHYYYSFGGMVDIEGYEHYYYDMEWNKVIDYRLLIYDVNSPEGYDYPTKWFEAHPDMQEEGIYYRRYEGAYTGEDTEGEVLTLEELKEIYETEMGMEMYSSRYVK